jgi:hypothetical protein
MVDFMTSGGPNAAATIALCDMPLNDRPLRGLADTGPDTLVTPRKSDWHARSESMEFTIAICLHFRDDAEV